MSVVFPIENKPRYGKFTATAGQTLFDIPFEFQQSADVKVQRTPAAGGEPTVLAMAIDYTVDGAGVYDGGSFTLVVGASDGDTLEVWGDAVLERKSSVVQAGEFRSKTQDDEHDRHRIIQQENSQRIDRSFLVPLGAKGGEIKLPAAGHFLKLDADGNLVDGGDADDIVNAQTNATAAAKSAEAAAESAEAAADSMEAAIALVADGDKGDVTLSDGGVVWNINEGAVDDEKLADEAVSTNKVADQAITYEKLGDAVKIYNPEAFGADPSSSDGVNDAAFSSLKSAVGNGKVDLQGAHWPVTGVPSLPGAFNGYWKVTHLDEGADVSLPAKGTIDGYQCIIEGGAQVLGWPQDTAHAYNGLVYCGYMPADGHVPGQYDWTLATSKNRCWSFTRFEQGVRFGQNTSWSFKVFAAGAIPPVSGVTTSATQIAIAEKDGVDVRVFYRQLAEYSQSTSGGGLSQAEEDWQNMTIDGSATLDAPLVAEINSRHSLSASGLPTLVHGLNCDGYNGGGGSFWFGFHGLNGISGPWIAQISSQPLDGAGALNRVANVGSLTEGVEPTVCWFSDLNGAGGGTRGVCGFIRSQAGAGYPIRFYTIETPTTDAAIEGATIQDCPWGNNFATYSPIPCRMRPRTNSADGGIVTTNTIYGDDDDELHAVFTGRRTRDGGPGTVGLYWLRVTKGLGLFVNLWARAEVVKLCDLYFANSNSTDTTNQVGVPSLCFSDPNTLHIFACDENPAIRADYDENFIRVFTIKFDDNYADAADQKQYDDATTWPTNVQRSPDYRGYNAEWVSIGESENLTIDSGVIAPHGSNARVIPESGTADTLSTIRGRGREGRILAIRSNSSSNTITVDEAGNIALDSTNTMTLDNARDYLILKYDKGADAWVEISRSNNAS